MKIFISWSGNLSHEVALVLRDWIPSVIQNLETYVSSEDIDKGARWSNDISKELESSNFGIVCLTKENIKEPWVNFEAGALSKVLDNSRVCPFLFGIKRYEIESGPLVQFQSTIFKKEDILKLMLSINKANDSEKLTEENLKNSFEVWWHNLEDDLNKYLEKISDGIRIDDINPNNFDPFDIYPYVRKLYSVQRNLLFDSENLTLNVNGIMDMVIQSNIDGLPYIKHNMGVGENRGLQFNDVKVVPIEDNFERSNDGEIKFERILDSKISQRWRIVFNPRLRKSEEVKYNIQYNYFGTKFISFEEFLDAKKRLKLPSDKEFESLSRSSPVPCMKLISTIKFPVGYSIHDPNFSVKIGGYPIGKEIERINSKGFFKFMKPNSTEGWKLILEIKQPIISASYIIQWKPPTLDSLVKTGFISKKQKETIVEKISKIPND